MNVHISPCLHSTLGAVLATGLLLLARGVCLEVIALVLESSLVTTFGPRIIYYGTH